MNEENHGIKVNIFGSVYAIRGEANENYIQALAKYVDEKMREIGQSTNLTSPLKISILTNINLADELFRLREQRQSQQKPETDAPLNVLSIAPEAISALSCHIQTALDQE